MREFGSRSDSGTRATVMAAVIRPMGTFTRKIHSQPSPSVSTPPTSGPTATAKPVVAPQMPKAVPRSSGANSWAISASDVANIMAPPIPWSPRETFSIVGEPARPQRSEAQTKSSRPTTKILRRPSRSAIEPDASSSAARASAYASTTHCRSSKLEPSSCWMLGRATFTIVMSSSSMKIARHTTRSVHHLDAMASRYATPV